MSELPESIRAELDVTPAWWDSQYQALIRKRIPRDYASHEDHDIAEMRSYANVLIYRTCVDCNVGIDPYEEGTE